MSLIFKLRIQRLPADSARRQDVIVPVKIIARDNEKSPRRHQIIASGQMAVELSRLIIRLAERLYLG